MQPEQVVGFGLMLVGAVCGGSFGLPSKYVKQDTPWEVLWGPFFFFVTILIPVAVAPLVVHDLGGIYSRVGMEKIVPVLVFGLLWGLGSMTLGMSFAFIGLSLAYALNYGAQIAFGSMIPMLLFDADQILTRHGAVILTGVGVCLVGVTVCGRAGILKERSLRQDDPGPEPAQATTSAAKKPKMLIGLVIGVVSGILCACYAVASAYAGPVGAEATAEAGAGRILLLAGVMAALHDAAIFFFGLGWIELGDLGVSVGYPVFMSFAIIVGNVHGFRTREWKGASRESIAWILAGIALLIVGVCLLAQGKAMMPT